MFMACICQGCKCRFGLHVPKVDLAKVASRQDLDRLWPGDNVPAYDEDPAFWEAISAEEGEKEVDREYIETFHLAFADGSTEPVTCPGCGAILGDGTTASAARRLVSSRMEIVGPEETARLARSQPRGHVPRGRGKSKARYSRSPLG